jgi:alkylation response protein AidB-like acyl-CoA dehydrogenase
MTHTPSLLDVIGTLVEGWGEREKQANDARVEDAGRHAGRDARSGILAAPMPLAFGGWDASLAETAEAVRRIARRAPSTALALVMPLGNAATTLHPGGGGAPDVARLLEGQLWIAAQVRAARFWRWRTRTGPAATSRTRRPWPAVATMAFTASPAASHSRRSAATPTTTSVRPGAWTGL